MQGCHFGVLALQVHLGVPDLTLESTCLVLPSKNCNDIVFGEKLGTTVMLSCTLFQQLSDFLVLGQKGASLFELVNLALHPLTEGHQHSFALLLKVRRKICPPHELRRSCSHQDWLGKLTQYTVVYLCNAGKLSDPDLAQ